MIKTNLYEVVYAADEDGEPKPTEHRFVDPEHWYVEGERVFLRLPQPLDITEMVGTKFIFTEHYSGSLVNLCVPWPWPLKGTP